MDLIPPGPCRAGMRQRASMFLQSCTTLECPAREWFRVITHSRGTLHDTSVPKQVQGAGWSGGIAPPCGRSAYCGVDSSASTRATAIHAPASPRIPPAATARVADQGCNPMSSKSLA